MIFVLFFDQTHYSFLKPDMFSENAIHNLWTAVDSIDEYTFGITKAESLIL